MTCCVVQNGVRHWCVYAPHTIGCEYRTGLAHPTCATRRMELGRKVATHLVNRALGSESLRLRTHNHWDRSWPLRGPFSSTGQRQRGPTPNSRDDRTSKSATRDKRTYRDRIRSTGYHGPQHQAILLMWSTISHDSMLSRSNELMTDGLVWFQLKLSHSCRTHGLIKQFIHCMSNYICSIDRMKKHYLFSVSLHYINN